MTISRAQVNSLYRSVAPPSQQTQSPVKAPNALRQQLSVAVLTLLGSSLVNASSEPPNTEAARVGSRNDADIFAGGTPFGSRNQSDAWHADTGMLLYQESDERIRTVEALVHAKRIFAEQDSLSLNLTVDTLTGGSPNGALLSRSVQTFATPSGVALPVSTATTTTAVQTITKASGVSAPPATTDSTGSSSGTSGSSGATSSTTSTVSTPAVDPAIYTAAPGQLPLDKSFHDQRVAFAVNRERPLGDANHVAFGGSVSHETDFASLSGNVAFARDFNGKSTTLSAGLNLEDDLSRPIGGAPVPWSDYAQFHKEGHKSKHVEDLLIGVTQIVTRRWISQFNYTVEHSNGYQNDPYKILSALDAQGNTIGYVYEARPQKRNRFGFYWDNKWDFDRDVFEVSARHTIDTWGVKSNAVELRYRWEVTDGVYLEPHARRYSQTAASFHRFYLLQGDPTIPYASADPRLAKMDALTFGLKLTMPFDRDTELSVRYEHYAQHGDGPATVPTQLQGLNLYPGLTASLFQAGMRYQF